MSENDEFDSNAFSDAIHWEEVRKINEYKQGTGYTNELLSNLIKENNEINSKIHTRVGWCAIWLFLIWANMIFFGI
jgi:hypothetical protein